jgi:uncharacterized protein (TIGR02246 family)
MYGDAQTALALTSTMRDPKQERCAMKASMAALVLVLAVASPSIAADLKEEIVAAEKRGWQAYADHDVKAYSDGWTDDAVEVLADGSVLMDKQAILADLKSTTCKVRSFDIANTKVRQVSPDVAILTYNLTQDVTCGATKLAPKANVSSLYVRRGGKWLAVHYQETAQH